MLNNFLSKWTPIIGKYFRPIVLLCLGIILIYAAWFMFSELLDFRSLWSGIESIFYILWALAFTFLGFVSIFFISKFARSRYGEGDYEAWGAGFYILIGVLSIYFILRVISQWMGFDILGYLKYYFGSD